MNPKRVSPQLITAVLVALCFGLALAFRVIFPYDNVFSGEWVKFTGNDAWYHMRIIDNFVHNFPHFNNFDPYFLYRLPVGLQRYVFFDYFSAAMIWLLGLGSPSQHTVDVVGAYIPAFAGALTIIPVYFIGKTIFNKWVGVLASAVLAILPGEFLGRSLLGFTDHHAMEVLLTTTALMFLLLALSRSRTNELNLNQLKARNWHAFKYTVVYSSLAGIFFGMYLITWRGSPIFIFILLLFFVAQYIISHLRKRDTLNLLVIGILLFFISVVIFMAFPFDERYLAALLIAIGTIGALYVVSHLMKRYRFNSLYYPLIVFLFGCAAAGIFYGLKTELFLSTMALFGKLVRVGARLTVLEAQPILFPGGSFSLDVIWGNFTTSLILGLIGLGFVIYLVIKKKKAESILMVVWTIVLFIAMLLMRRFAYYFAVNIAILTGYSGWMILRLFGAREQANKIEENDSQPARKGNKKKSRVASGPNRVLITVGIAVVLVAALVPNFGPAVRTASNPVFAPSDAWCESLTWLRDNSPAPFGDEDFYYQHYSKPFKYPSSVYSVVAWWDYGYWITRLGHRLPLCNPGGGLRDTVAALFIAQEENKTATTVKKYNSKYIVIDYDTATIKFHALPQYIGEGPDNYFEVYYTREGNMLRGSYYFYPRYYRSLAVRLYNFDAGAVTPAETTVIIFEEGVDIEGDAYKEIIETKTFPTYQEAESFIESQDSDNYRIVGLDPFISPVPLESLESFNPVFYSSDANSHPDLGLIPEVKIFEYTGELN